MPRGLLLWLTYGMLAPLLFTAIYLIEGLTRPGYDPWREPISALSVDPGGWIQQGNFVFLGLNTLLVAYVWRRVLYGGIGGTWYPIIRGIEGLSLVGIGSFSVHAIVHTPFLFVIIGTMMAELFMMARRYWRDPHWRGWTWYSAISAVMVNVLIVLFGVAHTHDFQFAGVLERLATNIEPIWGVVALARLWSGTPFMVKPLRSG